MRGILNDITRFARSRSSGEWKEFLREKAGDLRGAIQDNGEKAAFAAFAIGIFVVLFFRLFLILVALGALSFLTLLWISDSGTEAK
jgi:hypothetical protein